MERDRVTDFTIYERILIALYPNRSMTRQTLSETVAGSKIVVQNEIKWLERQGHVRSYRKNTRGRSKVYRLTKKGKEVANYPVRRAQGTGIEDIAELPKARGG